LVFSNTYKTKGRAALPYALLAFVILAVYSNAWSGDFLLDDVWAVAQNSFLRHWSTLPQAVSTLTFAGAGQPGGFYRPVLAFCWFLVFQVFGKSAIAYHGLNILIHVVNTCLVFRLGKKIGLREGVAFLATLLWAVHPLNVEAVTYISGLGDVLYTMFCLLGIVVLMGGLSLPRMAGTCLIYIIALGCKESAVVFPALALASLYLVGPERLSLPAIVRTWPLWILCGLYLGLLFYIVHSTGFMIRGHNDPEWMAIYGGNLPNRIYTALSTVPVYFGLMLWPVDLHLNRIYPFFESIAQWPVLLGAGMVLLAFAQVLWGRGKRGVGISWGLAWFAIAYSPNAGVVFPTDALIFEHWMYMPMAGLILSLATCLPEMPRRVNSVLAGLALLAAATLSWRSHDQNRIWQNTGTLIESALPYSDHNEMARNSLGVYYTSQGEFDKAIEQYRLVLENPAMLPPMMIPAVHMSLAFAYLNIRFNHDDEQSVDERIQAQYKTIHDGIPNAPHIPEAIHELETVLELNPGDHWAKVTLLMIYKYQGNEEKAAYYDRLIRQVSP
jgi:tetratricopeptide (TPR) repeat protein